MAATLAFFSFAQCVTAAFFSRFLPVIHALSFHRSFQFSRFVAFFLRLFIVAQEICMCNPILCVCVCCTFSKSNQQKVASRKQPEKNDVDQMKQLKFGFFFCSARLKLPSLIYFCFSVFNNENEHFSRVWRASWTTPKMNKNTHTHTLFLSQTLRFNAANPSFGYKMN